MAEIIFAGFEQPMGVEIEISLREAEKKGEMVAVANDFIPAYNIIAVTETQLVFEKMRALLSRKKPKKQKIIPQVLKALKESDINFGSELKQFLPKTHWAIIRDFKSTLTGELNRFSRLD